MQTSAWRRYAPFLLTVAIVLADQLSKAWVVAVIPLGQVHASYLHDFLWICHVSNDAIGFSLGSTLPLVARQLLFILLPLVLIALMVAVLLRTKELSGLQRWLVAGIIGGGLGNIIDRIFRPDWVVDFISVKVYGLLGFERWPTFNIADSSVVVTGLLLMLTMLFMKKKAPVSGEKEPGNE